MAKWTFILFLSVQYPLVIPFSNPYVIIYKKNLNFHLVSEASILQLLIPYPLCNNSIKKNKNHGLGTWRARERAWYCIRGLRPISPRTTTAALPLGRILDSFCPKFVKFDRFECIKKIGKLSKINWISYLTWFLNKILTSGTEIEIKNPFQLEWKYSVKYRGNRRRWRRSEERNEEIRGVFGKKEGRKSIF